jgi:hypothetical protein
MNTAILQFGKAVSETEFLIFFKNIEILFPKPIQFFAYGSES